MAKIIDFHEENEPIDEDQAEFDKAIAGMSRNKIFEMDMKVLALVLKKIEDNED